MTQAVKVKPRLTASKTVRSTTRTGNTGSINFYYICGNKDKIWIDRAAYSVGDNPTPFRFTGKERDPETGLVYFGARYLDPKTSRWLSGDPAMGEYVPVVGRKNNNLPNGGVYNSINLHAYRYGANNPVKYIDPNGEWDERIHLHRTRELARAYFSPEQVDIIARANNGTDHSSKGPMPWQNQSYHFNTNRKEKNGTPGDSRIQLAREHLKDAIYLMDVAAKFRETNGNNCAIAAEIEKIALERSGQGLHALQDIFAHDSEYEKEGRWMSHSFKITEAIRGRPHADDSIRRKKEADNTERATDMYLNMLKEGKYDENSTLWTPADW